ncbi:NAD-dependent epimerase/dehydratase family protein [Tundrisphaera lichenicola]|uniref:NAD-dependent epimerase/dehydratase family protein n=1 Tax=Tundrisphaera lichenicola TaxID=2029860 RepID=UPI003EBFEC65
MTHRDEDEVKDPEPLPILYDDETEDDPEEGLEDEVRTVLITGASGNIGKKLRAAWDDAYDLILIDREADPDDPEVVAADLSVYDEEWLALFHGADTVIHLAATPDEHSSWEDLVGPNLDAACNVFHASALAGVERVVFASSNHAMGGYRDLGDIDITVDLPPRPGNPYGAAKLMVERLGKSLSGIYEMTFVALRLGWVQRGKNRPETLPDEWNKELWLSDGDMVRLFDRAVEADLGDRSFVIVNGMSNNHGTRWDLASSFESIGFAPKDDAFAEDTKHPGPRSLG